MTTRIGDLGWLLDLYTQLAALPVSGRQAFVYRHPVLLSVDGLKMLAASEGDKPLLAVLDQMRGYLWDHPEAYPPDSGPLDDILQQLRLRRISAQEARARAVTPERAGLLSNTYIKVVFEALLKEVDSGAVFPTQAAEIVLDSAWAMPFERLSLHVRLAATRGFLLVAHHALVQHPNGRLLQRAHEAVAWAVSVPEVSRIASRRGDLLHELGATALDAYASRLAPSTDYPERIAEWLARATSPMPSADAGLADAVSMLTEAAPLRAPGSDRGTTLKALIQAKIYAAAARHVAPDLPELRQLAREALGHLGNAGDADERAWVEHAVEVYALE